MERIAPIASKHATSLRFLLLPGDVLRVVCLRGTEYRVRSTVFTPADLGHGFSGFGVVYVPGGTYPRGGLEDLASNPYGRPHWDLDPEKRGGYGCS